MEQPSNADLCGTYTPEELLAMFEVFRYEELMKMASVNNLHRMMDNATI